MPISSRIKSIAYVLDPKCWKTYSGHTVGFKRFMEARRASSLEAAANYCETLKHRVGSRSANLILDQHDKSIERWSGADWIPPFLAPPLEKTMTDTAQARWPGFKMKIFVHIATCAHYTFLSTLHPARNDARQRSRLASFDKYAAEMVADGLIVCRNPDERIFTLSKKGAVYADALLTLPLPVASDPKWIMPKDGDGGYKPGDEVGGYSKRSPVQEC